MIDTHWLNQTDINEYNKKEIIHQKLYVSQLDQAVILNNKLAFVFVYECVNAAAVVAIL